MDWTVAVPAAVCAVNDGQVSGYYSPASGSCLQQVDRAASTQDKVYYVYV